MGKNIRQRGVPSNEPGVHTSSKTDPPQKSLPGQPKAPPSTPPTFTLKEIRAAIPAHCFERNSFVSLGHLAVDLLLAGGLVLAAQYIQYAPLAAQVALWPLYWFALGTVLTGVWVLAHECGHGGFSDHTWLNDWVGTVTHSLLLVPYHSWQISHRAHHQNCNSVENDEVFVPSTLKDWGGEVAAETPIGVVLGIMKMLTFGWPAYLIINATGPAKYQDKVNDHWSPNSALFSKRQYWQVLSSDFAWVLAVAGLAYTGHTMGWQWLGAHYGIPYLVTNAYLVLITYLQHTDVYVPRFREGEWTWLRGALATVDRSFSSIIDQRIHHIADTHVCHHLFSDMPFYNAAEATEHIKRVIGDFYLEDKTNVLTAVYRSWARCKWVEDHQGPLWLRGPTTGTPAC